MQRLSVIRRPQMTGNYSSYDEEKGTRQKRAAALSLSKSAPASSHEARHPAAPHAGARFSA